MKGSNKIIICFDPSNDPKSDAQFMACFRKDEHTFVVSRLMSNTGIKNFYDHGVLLEKYVSNYNHKDTIILVESNLGYLDEYVKEITSLPVIGRLVSKENIRMCFENFQQWISTPNNKIEYYDCDPIKLDNPNNWMFRNVAYLIKLLF